MIDYEKLKKAHELANKLESPYYAEFIMSAYHNEYTINNSESPAYEIAFFITESLDNFITKLQELTMSKPKYKIGDKVWHLNDEYEPSLLFIEDIDYDSDAMYMDSNDNWWHEEQLYPSRESLIDAQIAYWTALKQEQIVPIEDMKPEFEGEVKGFDTHKCNQDSVKSFSIRDFDDEMEAGKCEHEYVPSAGGGGSVPYSETKQCIKCGESKTFITHQANKCRHEYIRIVNGDVFCNYCMPEKPCEHESDGITYVQSVGGAWRKEDSPLYQNVMHCKCKKCGEFYR